MTETRDIKIMDLLKRHGFHFKKKWGQNFILDKNLLRRIVEAAEIAPGSSVVEIGGGAGTLTKILAESGAHVLTVEIDLALIPVLEETLKEFNVVVIQGDVLKIDLDKLTKEYNIQWPYKIIANLPYYITTPIIMNILENEYHIDIMVIMIQWEVAARLTAQPGGKEFGAISLAVQYYTEAKILFKVGRHLFNPMPEVDSAVILMKRRRTPPVEVSDEKLMFKIIKAAFNHRRKTLLNALSSLEPYLTKGELQDLLRKVGIDGQRRGETLNLEEYARLSNAWQERLGKIITD